MKRAIEKAEEKAMLYTKEILRKVRLSDPPVFGAK